MSGLVGSVTRKAALAISTLFLVSVIIFAAAEALPQDTAMAALSFESTPQQRLLYRHELHLDDPPAIRYERWLGGALIGNFGSSLLSGRPITSLVLTRLLYTSILAVAALAFALCLALPLAVVSGRYSGRMIDTAISTAAIAISALPEFVLGICLLLIFGSWLRVLPVVSTGVTSADLSSYVLPVLTLGLGAGMYIFRLARVSVAETLSAPYVRNAVLRGFSPRRILWLHVMPNASVTIVNVVALNAIYLLGGVIVVENVFAYPGLGSLLVSAINFKDIPEIEAVALLVSAIVIVINLVADVVVLLISPRLRAVRTHLA